MPVGTSSNGWATAVTAVFRDSDGRPGRAGLRHSGGPEIGRGRGYTPRIRVGVGPGRPQRMAADWLGVDVNVAARVMERATKGGIMISSSTLDLIPQSELDALGVVAKRARKPVFAAKTAGVPADLGIYRLRTLKELTGSDHTSETN